MFSALTLFVMGVAIGNLEVNNAYYYASSLKMRRPKSFQEFPKCHRFNPICTKYNDLSKMRNLVLNSNEIDNFDIDEPDNENDDTIFDEFDFSPDSSDSLSFEEETGLLPDDTWRKKIESIITDVITSFSSSSSPVYLSQLKWTPTRLEVTVSCNSDPLQPEGPPVTIIERLHRQLYSILDTREDELAFISRFEILVASPGVSDRLQTDKDFIFFRAFPVTVTTTEEYKKKTRFEGTLVERTEDKVIISLKGRLVRIPRHLVSEVRLPKSKFETTDKEMRKLR
mmetsp:Transcript_26296/g.26548  ORF Transcript_26296/g.26548 Transcript_26296/m.26548 type:complete len:283 (+) Transcript_26296:238-1086(+)